MIGVFITLHYGDDFNEEGLLKIAETARGRFERMPGLRSKAFTINSGKREATNFYIWDSANAAQTALEHLFAADRHSSREAERTANAAGQRDSAEAAALQRS